MGFKVAILLQQLSPSGSGYIVLSLHVVVQGNMCHITLDHGGGQGGTGQDSDFSIHPSERQKSAFLFTVHPQAPLTNPCVVRQVSAQLHQLSPYTLSSYMDFSSSFSAFMAESVFLPACCHLNAQPGTSNFTSYPAPPMMSYFLPIPPYFLPFFGCFSQGKSSQ